MAESVDDICPQLNHLQVSNEGIANEQTSLQPFPPGTYFQQPINGSSRSIHYNPFVAQNDTTISSYPAFHYSPLPYGSAYQNQTSFCQANSVPFNFALSHSQVFYPRSDSSYAQPSDFCNYSGPGSCYSSSYASHYQHQSNPYSVAKSGNENIEQSVPDMPTLESFHPKPVVNGKEDNSDSKQDGNTNNAATCNQDINQKEMFAIYSNAGTPYESKEAQTRNNAENGNKTTQSYSCAIQPISRGGKTVVSKYERRPAKLHDQKNERYARDEWNRNNSTNYDDNCYYQPYQEFRTKGFSQGRGRGQGNCDFGRVQRGNDYVRGQASYVYYRGQGSNDYMRGNCGNGYGRGGANMNFRRRNGNSGFANENRNNGFGRGNRSTDYRNQQDEQYVPVQYFRGQSSRRKDFKNCRGNAGNRNSPNFSSFNQRPGTDADRLESIESATTSNEECNYDVAAKLSTKSDAACSLDIGKDDKKEVKIGTNVLKNSYYREEESKDQREKLTEQLLQGSYECMVCCDRVRQQHAIWSCKTCYNCFHLGCIKKWASTSASDENGWRCPSCNNLTAKRPNTYKCFCGKMKEPQYNRLDIPHSCGEICGRARENMPWCTHRCTDLCHPGPCSPCIATFKKSCSCGATSKEMRCSNGGVSFICKKVCSKLLECGVHTCMKSCHEGRCEDCNIIIKKVCYCTKTTRESPCTSASSLTASFACEKTCGHLLNCGNHRCELLCHEGLCQPCHLAVERVTHCPCGKKTLSMLYEELERNSTKKDGNNKDILGRGRKSKRVDLSASNVIEVEASVSDLDEQGSAPKDDSPSSLKEGSASGSKDDQGPSFTVRARSSPKINRRVTCTDPVPTCGLVCDKQLSCGKPGNFHRCKLACHEGPCPPCPLMTAVKCRCGAMSKSIACTELKTKADEVTCEKPCKKLRFCGRHKCGTKCCIDIDHQCPLQCGKYLPCGKHRCKDTCHPGACERCWIVSWEELTCHCGAAVTFPPVPCGTKPPPCDQLCSRVQKCTHPVTHSCHPEESCPPCTVLMEAPCHGHHKKMKSTPCYQKAISCGELCDKPLPCGFHRCDRICHDGPCIQRPAKGKSSLRTSQCPQKCKKPRSGCSHPCAAPCHTGDCPLTNCQVKVTVSCKCGERSVVMSCHENEREYRAVAAAKLATQLQHVNSAGNSVDISHIMGSENGVKENRFKRLECHEACHAKERNSRLALALQIENPDSRSSLGSANSAANYSDFLKEETKKDPHFAGIVHKALSDLVIKAKDSKQPSRSHSFAPMSRDKRQFIHEYCKFFGCTSIAYDEEPKKNVVVTAKRGLCLMPVTSIMDVVKRINGGKKVPGPVWGPRIKTLASDTLAPSSSMGGLRKLEKTRSIETEGGSSSSVVPRSASDKPVIDYFDYDG